MITPVDQLERIRNIVAQYDCTLIDFKYTNRNTPMEFRCKCNKIFSSSWKNLSSRIRNTKQSTCQSCSRRKWTNDTVVNKLQNRNITLLSDLDEQTSPSTTNCTFKCDECNYEWKATIDNVINKKSGCPKCANNIPYTLDSLQAKLAHRHDLVVVNIITSKYKMGIFLCCKCNQIWQANVHNVIKFNYGCPVCNTNSSIPVFTEYGKFHSKLEYYFWEEYHKKQISYHLIRQHKYLDDRKLTVDFMIPDLKLWVEISGQFMIKQSKYITTLNEKQQILNNIYPDNTLIILNNHSDIINFINLLKDKTT